MPTQVGGCRRWIATAASCGSPECAPQPVDERRGAVARSCGAEDVEVGTLQYDADAVLLEPVRVAAVDVVNGPSRGDVGRPAAERREEGREVGPEHARRIGHPAEQGEAPPDDVVEASDGVAAADLALHEEVAGERIAVEEQARADRRRRELWGDARLARGGGHLGVPGARLLRIRTTDIPARLDRERDLL